MPRAAVSKAGTCETSSAQEADRTVHERDEASERGQQRGLPGSVGAEHGEDLVADLEVEALEYGHSVVPAAQAGDLDEGLIGRLRHAPLPGTSPRPCGALGWTRVGHRRTTLPSAMKWTLSHSAPDDVEVVLDDDHGGALGREPPHLVHDLLGQLVRQTRRRLVHEQEAWLEQQAAHDVEQLLLTRRQGVRGGVVEAEVVEVVAHLLLVRLEDGPLRQDPVRLLVALPRRPRAAASPRWSACRSP